MPGSISSLFSKGMPRLEPECGNSGLLQSSKKAGTKKLPQLGLGKLLKRLKQLGYFATRVTLNSVRRLRWYSSSDFGATTMGRLSP